MHLIYQIDALRDLQDMTGLLSVSGATGLTRSEKPTPLRQTPSPDLVAPIGASTVCLQVGQPLADNTDNVHD